MKLERMSRGIPLQLPLYLPSYFLICWERGNEKYPQINLVFIKKINLIFCDFCFCLHHNNQYTVSWLILVPDAAHVLALR